MGQQETDRPQDGGAAPATQVVPAPMASWPRSSRSSTLLAAVLIAVVAVAAYANSFHGPFVCDDLASIPYNPTIRQLHNIGTVLSPPRGGETVSGRPLLNLSLALNYALGGCQVWGYHATNLAIHILCALLLFGVVRQTLFHIGIRDWGLGIGKSLASATPIPNPQSLIPAKPAAAATPLAFAIALLWTVHPLQTESVTYIIQRAESLAGLFSLLTLYGVIRGATLHNGRWWYATAVLGCLMGMATKEVTAGVPLVVLLYDRMFLAHSWREVLQRRWELYLGLAATWLLLGWLVWSTGLLGRRSETGAPDVVSYAATQPQVVLYYLRLSLWPHPLCQDYHGWPVARGAGVIIPALLIAALLAAAVVGMARGRAWSFLAAGFLILLAPTSSLLPLTDMAAEHRMYLPLAAVLTALVRLVYHAGQSIVRRGMLSRSAAIAVGGCLTLAACATLGIFTSRRNVDYRSEISLWEDTVAKTPGNARAHYNLGVALLQSGRVAEAMGSFRKALDITPRHAESHYNLGVALAHQQRLAEAVAQYQQALEINPHVAAFHCTLGIALLQQGRFADATTQFQKALEIRPRYAEADYNWGEALSQQGRLTEAIACYRKALEIDPRLAEAHNNLGNALGRLGKAAEAMAQYQQALSIRPDYAEAHYNLGVVYGRQGRLAEALAHYQRAVDTRPDFAEAQNNLASASYQLRMQYGTVGAMNATAWVLATTPDDSIRNGRQAVASAQRAVQLSDNRDPAVLDTLAAAYAEAGQFVAAIETARRAWELASAGTDKPLANHIHARIVLYRNQKPYRTPTASPTPRNRGAQE